VVPSYRVFFPPFLRWNLIRSRCGSRESRVSACFFRYVGPVDKWKTRAGRPLFSPHPRCKDFPLYFVTYKYSVPLSPISFVSWSPQRFLFKGLFAIFFLKLWSFGSLVRVLVGSEGTSPAEPLCLTDYQVRFLR